MSLGVIPRVWPLIARGIQRLETYPGGPRGFAEDVVRGVGYGIQGYKVAKNIAKAYGVHKVIEAERSVKKSRKNIQSIDNPFMVKRRFAGSIIRRRRRRPLRRPTHRFRAGKSRFGHGRRRFGRRFGRGGVKRVHHAIPTVTSREFSMVTSFADGARYLPLSIANSVTPSQFFQFFKEYRLERCLVALRRRRPPCSVFESATGGNTVAAGREETNDIYWVPWSTTDLPVQHPRQIKSARMLTAMWSVCPIRQRCIEMKLINRPLDDFLATIGGVPPNQIVTDNSWAGTTQKFPGYAVQSWTRMPWQQTDASLGDRHLVHVSQLLVLFLCLVLRLFLVFRILIPFRLTVFG
ncbi:putative capsid protein [Deer faeces associated circular DNA virus 1]|uniref:putative capsid protein n=1 Tax=Deer faeces associated circular DNA virus 1 TaxID=1843767 RepID=UPI0007C1D703|nr:putative capsid protein [Deer faeces associated circular DNA virus 1]ANC51551.1 putative capsid protein [Deer faeces associated circular DNA virus 1]